MKLNALRRCIMNYKNSQFETLIKNALAEDIGRRDITTEAIIPKNKFIKARMIAKEEFVLCGLNIAGLVFKTLDKNMHFKPKAKDGQKINKGRILADILGQARSILSAERTALNFVSLLSGIATKTKEFTDAVKPYKASPIRKSAKRRRGFSDGVKIMDTRKTIPGLRILEKYAVKIGGGYNHRMKLDEMILVKDNHIKVARGYQSLPELARGYIVELEVKNLKELREALKLTPDIIMLDNMSLKEMRRAVKIRGQLPVKLEASGGITLENVKKIASTGIDSISVGELTHSVDSVDISLEIL
jgi:nicotinate-nucleotide pyrophosphorylase (carboxylating)